MTFSYAVPARRFYGARVIDDHDVRYEADRTLIDNVRVLAQAEWGPVRATRAVAMARLVSGAVADGAQPPHARQWAAAILCAAAGDGTPRTLALIENRTGVSPTELAAHHRQLMTLIEHRATA